MPLGRCTVCDQLVTITPGRVKRMGLRQRDWIVADHEVDGKPCPGVRAPL
jgi:hypothetical protein